MSLYAGRQMWCVLLCARARNGMNKRTRERERRITDCWVRKFIPLAVWHCVYIGMIRVLSCNYKKIAHLRALQTKHFCWYVWRRVRNITNCCSLTYVRVWAICCNFVLSKPNRVSARLLLRQRRRLLPLSGSLSLSLGRKGEQLSWQNSQLTE